MPCLKSRSGKDHVKQENRRARAARARGSVLVLREECTLRGIVDRVTLDATIKI